MQNKTVVMGGTTFGLRFLAGDKVPQQQTNGKVCPSQIGEGKGLISRGLIVGLYFGKIYIQPCALQQ